jgi:Domain of unknown function (DUF5134)
VVSVALRWTLTVAFAVSGVYCLARCVRPASDRACSAVHERVSQFAHSVMSVLMVAMVWAWTIRDRWGVLMTFFALAAGWFVVEALDVGRRSASRPRTAQVGLVHQAVAMGAMFWMLFGTSTASGVAASGMTEMAHAGASSRGTQSLPSMVVTLAIAGYLACAAVWWLGRCSDARARSPRGGAIGDAMSQAVMAAAMSVALVAGA